MRVALPVVNFFSIWIRAPPGQSDGISYHQIRDVVHSISRLKDGFYIN